MSETIALTAFYAYEDFPEARLVLDDVEGVFTVEVNRDDYSGARWDEFIAACHYIAGENGCAIKFRPLV